MEQTMRYTNMHMHWKLWELAINFLTDRNNVMEV